jgi:hypothetical protein
MIMVVLFSLMLFDSRFKERITKNRNGVSAKARKLSRNKMGEMKRKKVANIAPVELNSLFTK